MRPGEADVTFFERFMAFLARHFNVLQLSYAIELLKSGRLPKRACCITFDDGYADNLTVALPVLEKYRLPAAIFVATAYLDGGRMFNDAVIDAIAATPHSQLDLSTFGLGRLSVATWDEKRSAVGKILELFKYMPPTQRNDAVATLMDLSGCGELPKDLMLTSRQLVELSRRGIEIGGHTVNHAILTTLDNDTAEREIMAGKEYLESVIGKEVICFAYPNGRPGRDYELRHVDMVRKAGFKAAVSTAPGVAVFDSDAYQIPRFTPWGRSMMLLGARMMRNAWTGNAQVQC